ncbi:hypothetical protein WA026_017644 [Henosepilachna vigintioctopunctata]|uniref:Ig-like domain-containing protein n=1 Tax=Henosepilachna vigintioctopunctata TaxID=420089 RepID=A0AAW1U095_9CUCU
MKAGSTLNLHCNKADNVVWLFKACEVDYDGTHCDNTNLEHTRNAENTNVWKVLHLNDAKKILKLENVTLEQSGIYRCVSRNIVRKQFIVKIDAVLFKWPPPKVISVKPNSDVIHVHSHLTINCRIVSRSPPKILWFKVCWIDKCEIDFRVYGIEIGDNNNCLCLTTETNNNNTYNWDNFYISKLHVFNVQISDGGTYVCSALSSDGKDYKNVTVEVKEATSDSENISHYSYLILLIIPLILISFYIVTHMCFTRKKKKRDVSKRLQHLLSPGHVISHK